MTISESRSPRLNVPFWKKHCLPVSCMYMASYVCIISINRSDSSCALMYVCFQLLRHAQRTTVNHEQQKSNHDSLQPRHSNPTSTARDHHQPDRDFLFHPRQHPTANGYAAQSGHASTAIDPAETRDAKVSASSSGQAAANHQLTDLSRTQGHKDAWVGSAYPPDAAMSENRQREGLGTETNRNSDQRNAEISGYPRFSPVTDGSEAGTLQ